MLSSHLLLGLLSLILVQLAQSEPIPAKHISQKTPLLVDFNAARGDDPKVLGVLNLEKARGDKVKGNTPDVYIKSDKDPKGVPAAHFHRSAGALRAEYHALSGKTKSGTTYFISYQFQIEDLPTGVMIFQWKEYKANKSGGANIPLALQINKNQLVFKDGSKAQWSQAMQAKKTYKIGIEILAKADGGHAKLWVDGKLVTSLTGNTFPGESDPKFGIYSGDTSKALDSYVYQVQIGTNMADLDQSYFGGK